jgi:hypothetical protein
LLQLLLSYGADPSAVTPMGITPLHAVCRQRPDDDGGVRTRRLLQLLRLLLAFAPGTAEHKAASAAGGAPLVMESKEGKEGKEGKDTASKSDSKEGKEGKQQASGFGPFPIGGKGSKFEININARNKGRRATPLFECIGNGQDELGAALVAAGADLSLTYDHEVTFMGSTAKRVYPSLNLLHMACLVSACASPSYLCPRIPVCLISCVICRLVRNRWLLCWSRPESISTSATVRQSQFHWAMLWLPRSTDPHSLSQARATLLWRLPRWPCGPS